MLLRKSPFGIRVTSDPPAHAFWGAPEQSDRYPLSGSFSQRTLKRYFLKTNLRPRRSGSAGRGMSLGRCVPARPPPIRGYRDVFASIAVNGARVPYPSSIASAVARSFFRVFSATWARSR